MTIPNRQFMVTGASIHRAPPALRPYFDCIDGAAATGGTYGPGTAITSWALFRGGAEVGEIFIREDGLPLEPADLQMVADVRRRRLRRA